MKINVDGKAIEYVDDPTPLGDVADLRVGHPKLYNTLPDQVTVGTPNGRP